MADKTFCAAGVCIRFVSESEIGDSRFFDAFRADGARPDMTVTVKRGTLPAPHGRVLLRTQKSSTLLDGDVRRTYSAYYDGKENKYRDFACFADGPDGLLLTVDHESGLWDSMLMTAVDAPGRLLRYGAAVLHASFVIVNGEALLFTGRSGIGKTTQAKLWQKYRGAELVNGDRAALKFHDGRLYAYGVPFCGSSDTALNQSAPVKAIVSLSQADENTLRPMTAAQAFGVLMSGFSYEPRDEEQSRKAADLAAAASAEKIFCSFGCLPDESAVCALEAGLWEK